MKAKKASTNTNPFTLSYFKNTKDTSLINRWTIGFIIVAFLALLISYFQTERVTRGPVSTELIAPIPIALLLLLISFTLVYVFLRAFENKKLAYRKGYSIFIFAFFIPITFSYLVTVISLLAGSSILRSMLLVLNGIVLIFSIVLLIAHLRNFYKISGYRVLVSIILANSVFALFAVLEYVAVLAITGA